MSVSPPRPKMPQLNALRAFEASARLGSISAAAQELYVTPAAVAQHVKLLEAWAGEKLFLRSPQGVELTPLGLSVLADFEFAFDALGNAVQKLRTSASPRDVRIAALPSIAQHWLSPRLPEVRLALPDVSISVIALEQCPNLTRDPFDLAVFFEEEPDSVDYTVIKQDVIFPVCSPDLAKRVHNLNDLKREVFIHDSTWRDDWRLWLESVDPKTNVSKSGPEFSLYSLALEECRNGAGFLIGHEALVQREILAGSLVAPFKHSLSLDRWLAIRLRKTHKNNPLVHQIVAMLCQRDS